jgi:uncharacterized protein
MKLKKARDERTAELFATPGGIRAVDSPVRIKILSMLLKKEMSFDEIVEASGRAKSTISVHLKSLADEDIVSSRVDPADARKKVFFIHSSYLGGLSRRKKLEKDMEEYISKYAMASGDPFAFFRLMFRSIRVALLNDGIDIDPVLRDAGTKVGEALYPQIADPDLDKLLANLSKFWEAQRLGRLEFQGFDPLEIVVHDCFECQDLPYLGRTACAFDSGILETVFSKHFKAPAKVKETRCYAMGDDHCRFIIEGKK